MANLNPDVCEITFHPHSGVIESRQLLLIDVHFTGRVLVSIINQRVP